MSNWLKNKSALMLAVGLAMGLLVGAGMMIGTLSTLEYAGPAPLILPETALHATATDSGETMAIATGPVDEDVEGFFVLDFLTGDLQCQVINARRGKFGALFRTNVRADLGMGQSKKPKFLMVTGLASFNRGGGAFRPGFSAVYVIDANTGKFAAYGVPWNRQLAITSRPQTGALRLLDVGQIGREGLIRE